MYECACVQRECGLKGARLGTAGLVLILCVPVRMRACVHAFMNAVRARVCACVRACLGPAGRVLVVCCTWRAACVAFAACGLLHDVTNRNKAQRGEARLNEHDEYLDFLRIPSGNAPPFLAVFGRF